VVVNDCAHVMEDILPHFSSDFEIQFLQRTRGLRSKTFGVLWKIAKSKGEIYHVNYALQDAYLVSKFKHLDILHCHGSDIRWTMENWKWGRIVRHNLKSAKVVLYSTPDLEEKTKSYREDAIYLPTPVKTNVFTPKVEYGKYPHAVYFKLHYEKLPMELAVLLGKHNISLDIVDRNIPYSEMPSFLSMYDIFIDRFAILSFSKTCLEAMSCRLATIDHRQIDDLSERVSWLSDIANIKKEGVTNRIFIEKNHNVELVANKLALIWKGLEKKQ